MARLIAKDYHMKTSKIPPLDLEGLCEIGGSSHGFDFLQFKLGRINREGITSIFFFHFSFRGVKHGLRPCSDLFQAIGLHV